MHAHNKINPLPMLHPRLAQQLQTEYTRTKELKDCKKELGLSSAEIYEKLRLEFAGSPPAMQQIIELTCPGPHGDFPARLYIPKNKGNRPRPLMVFCHGGGFVVGSMDSHDNVLRRLAELSAGPVLAFNYHLAPAYKHPVPMDECHALLEWILPQAESYGFQAKHIALAGDSAGATIALSTFLRLREQGSPVASHIRALLLYYGFFGLESSMSGKLHGGWWDGMTEEDVERYFSAYISPENRKDPSFNLFEQDLSYGLPPCYILGCEFDPILDDSRALAAILKQHDLPHHFHILDNMVHACLAYYEFLPEVDRAMDHSIHYWLQEEV